MQLATKGRHLTSKTILDGVVIAGQGLLGLVDVGNLLGRDDVTVLGEVLDGFLVGGSHDVQFSESQGSLVWGSREEVVAMRQVWC